MFGAFTHTGIICAAYLTNHLITVLILMYKMVFVGKPSDWSKQLELKIPLVTERAVVETRTSSAVILLD